VGAAPTTVTFVAGAGFERGIDQGSGRVGGAPEAPEQTARYSCHADGLQGEALVPQ
jgi:hypothetical protein